MIPTDTKKGAFLMPKWLDNAVFYEIYPQSFLDTNADGIGDFQGIINKLGYIRELGCSATACGTIREGVALALEQAGPDGAVLCYGSLYLIGDVELQLRELRK